MRIEPARLREVLAETWERFPDPVATIEVLAGRRDPEAAIPAIR